MEDGVPLVIDSDAHNVGELDNISYGITMGRRAWLQAKHVINTLSLKGLLKAAA